MVGVALLGTALGLDARRRPGRVHHDPRRIDRRGRRFVVPATQLAMIVALAAAGVLGAVRPARHAARLDVLGSIST